MATPNLLYRFDPSKILQPVQGYFSAMDAGAFGPNLTVWSGQGLGTKTADGKLYPYSSGTITATAPGAPTGVVSAGGTLANGAYFALITALYGTGESKKGTESATATATAGNNTVTWTWTPIAGATGYNFYRTAAAGASTTETLITSIPANVTTFVDTGAIAAGATTPPASNSAAPTDGTQICQAVSQYSFVTDANGMAIMNSSVIVGSPAAAISGYLATPNSTMPYFYRGAFDPRDLLGVDATAITQLLARTLPDGNLLIV